MIHRHSELSSAHQPRLFWVLESRNGETSLAGSALPSGTPSAGLPVLGSQLPCRWMCYLSEGCLACLVAAKSSEGITELMQPQGNKAKV